MSTDTDLRRAYSRATDDASTGPDLGEVLALGRGARRRRARLRLAGAAGLATAVVAAGVLAPRLTRSDDVVAPEPAPAATDFVAGTDVDQTLMDVVAAHLPALGAPRDVFPSSTDHNGPMPDADFASATDWQAEYDLGGGGLFRLFVGHPAGSSAYGCPDCAWSPVADGRTSTQISERLGTDGSARWRFLVVFEADDGFLVSVLEEIPAASEGAAAQARSFTDAQLLELARDDRLTFPDPTP
ncbi:hypothetical protein [Nocardioides sp.]|uniref:hypothetical protein n=1 Tax=Nocardioides sp. TaxID=35761 RepID=UPI0035B0C532